MSDKAEEPKVESTSTEATVQTIQPETKTATTEPETKIEENSQEPILDEQSEGKKRPIDEVDQESDSEKDSSESNITEAKRSKAEEAKENEETQPEDTQSSKEDTSKDETTKEDSKEDSTKEDKKTTDNDKEEETKEPEKPKFVFGSGAFGKSSGFSMFGAPKNVFADKSATETTDRNKESAASNSPAPKSIFGGGSSFGNAFQKSMNKKSIFDTLPSKSESESQDEDKEKSKEVYKTVHLEKQDIKSGEEEESTQFQVKSKLYHLDLTNVSDGWKEKGVGILKVNKFLKPKGHYNGRLVMRQDGILKLILNVPIIKGFEVFKGMVSSMSSDKFIRFQVVEDDKPAQYALKIGQIENSAKLFDEITKLIPKDA